MIFELYIFLSVAALALLMVSWYRPDNIMFLWIPAIFAVSLGVLSLDVQVLQCEQTISQIDTSTPNISAYTYVLNCDKQLVQDIGMSWLWYGIGVLQIAWAIVNTVMVAAGIRKKGDEYR